MLFRACLGGADARAVVPPKAWGDGHGVTKGGRRRRFFGTFESVCVCVGLQVCIKLCSFCFCFCLFLKHVF